MSKQTPINIGIGEADRAAIAQGLSRLLADTYTLYLTTHNFHWNVTGPMFNTLHAMFMQQYTDLWTAVDPIAERIRALGHFAPGSYADFGQLASVPDAPRPAAQSAGDGARPGERSRGGGAHRTRAGAAGRQGGRRADDGPADPAPRLPREDGLDAAQHAGRLKPLKERLALYLDLIRWNRPAGWLLLLWPTLSALWVAAHGFPGWHLLAVFSLGTFLMRSAGCCANDVADREFDRHVKRTAQRPVTRGAVSVREALSLGAVLALLAFALVLTTNAAAIAWSFAALAITLLYPYAKRFVSMPQAVLGIAFSFGIPMAFAAVQSRVPLLAWVLLLGNLFWVLAYDTEYAMVDRDDDLRIGMKTSAITLGRADVPVIMLCYASYLVIWTLALAGRVAPVALGVSMAAAAAQAFWHYLLIRNREREGCFKAFRLNHWLGFTVFAGVVAGYAIR